VEKEKKKAIMKKLSGINMEKATFKQNIFSHSFDLQNEIKVRES
jgi:hypothetical protein